MVTKVLEQPTLVLNRNWQPVHVATVERALVLLWNESARVVDPEGRSDARAGGHEAAQAAEPAGVEAAVRGPHHADRKLVEIRQRSLLER